MNRYNHPLNNPHVFFFEIQNNKTFDVAYSLPYSIDDTPTEQDVDDLAKQLAEAIKTKREALGWEHPDLFYRICYHSALKSHMALDFAFDIYHDIYQKVYRILDDKE